MSGNYSVSNARMFNPWPYHFEQDWGYYQPWSHAQVQSAEYGYEPVLDARSVYWRAEPFYHERDRARHRDRQAARAEFNRRNFYSSGKRKAKRIRGDL